VAAPVTIFGLVSISTSLSVLVQIDPAAILRLARFPHRSVLSEILILIPSTAQVGAVGS
jgi:hypothetical protein